MAVRRLTPKECERLQGFPDGFTDIVIGKKKNGRIIRAKDGPRYRALGNSMAVPVLRWIMGRL
jgi:DNA (cytosine-5)-methyltransferase 1